MNLLRSSTLALVCCASSGGLLTRLHAQSHPGLVGATVIWNDSATSPGSVSRDGRWLLHTDWSTGNLAIRDLARGSSRQVTTDGSVASNVAYSTNAVLSPDGSHAAFNWSTMGSLEVRVIPLAGGEPRVLHVGRDTQYVVQGWSPDGRALLVVRRKSGQPLAGEIGFLELASQKFTTTGHAGSLWDAALSPDGNRIAWAQLGPTDPTRRQVLVADLRMKTRHVLSKDGHDEHSPTFSADSRALVFLSDRDGVPSVWHVALGPKAEAQNPRSLGATPDALNSILGVTTDGTVFLGAEDLGGERAFIARVDWSSGAVRDHRELKRRPFTRVRRAVFSPDGGRVAYLSKIPGGEVRPGWQTPVVQPVDGGEEKTYPTRLTLRDEPIWNVDGRALLFAAPSEGTMGEGDDQKYRFVRLDLESGVYSVTDSASARGQMRIAATNAESIFYLVNDFSGSASLHERNLKTRVDRVLYRVSGNTIADAALSPDGRRIAIALGRTDQGSTLIVLARADTSTVRIANVRGNARAQLAWFPDSESIIMTGRVSGEQGIWRIPIDGTTAKRLQMDGADFTEVRVSGDTRWIAWTRRERRANAVLAFRTRESLNGRGPSRSRGAPAAQRGAAPRTP